MYKIVLVILVIVSMLGHVASATGAPAASMPKTKVNLSDGAKMVLIPAGEFQMGTNMPQLSAWLQAHSNEQAILYPKEAPQHKVYLDAYYIYQNDVTVAQYRMFCQATGRTMPPNGPLANYPVVNVTWDDANAYAQWAGAQLPTEAQWEKAARGTDKRIFPWGNNWDAGKCRQCVGHKLTGRTAPVGIYPTGASPYGVLDMAGNVLQWCADRFDNRYYLHSPRRNPTGPPTGAMRVLRGGSWYSRDAADLRVTRRNSRAPSVRDIGIGFRCVVSLHLPLPPAEKRRKAEL